MISPSSSYLPKTQQAHRILSPGWFLQSWALHGAPWLLDRSGVGKLPLCCFILPLVASGSPFSRRNQHLETF